MGRQRVSRLTEEKIPLVARIMSVADVYDALTSERVYKPPFTHEESVALIQKGRGTQFDPLIVDAFMSRESDFAVLSRQSTE